MTDLDFLHALRSPTEADPLRVLVSACLTGIRCGVDGTSNGEYPSVLKLLEYRTVRPVPFCPEDVAFGTPRETPDCLGGDGHDVLDGKARVITETGRDVTKDLIAGAFKMLECAQDSRVELAVMMDVSGACGSQVVYHGSRFAEQPVYQQGMGVAAALLKRHGFQIISQRDFASLEVLYAKLDPLHEIDRAAIDHHQTEWYVNYFGLG